MTTNAIDRTKLVVASDSRWSAYIGNYFCFVDDTGFDKIAARDFGVIICAGDAQLIQAWKDWFFAEELSSEYPATERTEGNYSGSIDITMLSVPDGTILIERGDYIRLQDEAMFAGSGSNAASNCFAANRCALRSIASAASVDMHTGGETMFVELATGKSNLSQEVRSYKDAETELRTRGTAMNLADKKVIPMSEFLKVPATPAAASAKVEINLSAPTGDGYKPWTAAEKQELALAVEQMVQLQRDSKR